MTGQEGVKNVTTSVVQNIRGRTSVEISQVK